ncbi:MAG TPA: carboxypeptidase-like regulatory domain-containing protein [Bryobacteraceae bacterium]|nr:carboxypeptidase-like regulatory domain-containing protein [Bryobacteraceae bacterium]
MNKQKAFVSIRLGVWTTVVAAICGVAVVAPCAMAQSATAGGVVGTVSDPSGAFVPKADVTLVNAETGTTQSQITTDSGGFAFPNVAPGLYTLTVKMGGFRTATIATLSVEVNRSTTVPVKLEVGGDKEIVEVTATAAAQLQTTDAQIGNTISVDTILRMPNLTRNATELMNLQPATTAVGNSIMMRVGGAIDDQNTVTVDGIDITQNIVAAGVSVPTPADSIEEFRSSVTNPNADFDRASGANIALVGRHGGNAIHAALYEYLQNSDLNSNTWENNLIGIPRAVIHDNRFGGRLGGPIKKNKTFLFGNFEERRFQSAAQVQRTVPTQALRNGILQFRDSGGNIQQFNLKTAAVCGADGNQACDPRGLGVSPSVAAQWAKEPLPNVPGGDGLNTGAFFGVLSTPIRNDYGVARLDHIFTDRLQFNGSYTYYRQIQTSSAQISIVDGNLQSVRQPPNRGSVTSASLTYQLKPNLVNTFRFGYVHDTDDTGATPPSKAAGVLNLPGTQTSAGPIALLIGGGVSSFLDSPIDMDTQRSRHQADYAGYWQFIEDMNWVRGKHTVSFGAQFNKIPYTHVRADKVVGSLSSLAALVDGDSNFLFVTSANQPQTCSAAITSNCIRSTDLKNWDRFYASTLGLVNNVGILTARDANLKPLPFGTDLRNQTNQYATYFHAQDSWRATPSLTFTYGLAYGWQTAPTEVHNLQTLQINAESGAFISGPEYIAAKQAAALGGQTYNPLLGFQPVGSAHHSVVNIDWGDVAPRASLAWNPSGGKGFLGSLLGERKTVIRGGFAIVYDRTNTVQTVLIPMLGVGFAQTITVQGPLCNATGSGGASCNPAAGTGNVGLSAFRVGTDGSLPLPTVPAVSIPVIPPVGQYSETLSFQDDPNSKVGRSYNIDLSIQRELPGNMILELGFIGRQGRRLPQAVSLGNAPYMLVDQKSGQSFAQAFDATAQSLRAGTTPATQPWFENQFPGLNPGGTATTSIINAAKASFTTGDVANLFQTLDSFRRKLSLPTYNNDQVLDLFMRTYVAQSNYNAGIVTLTKRMSRGLTVSGNYTYAKALDDNILNQNQAFFFSNSYHPGIDYGPSRYDARHTFNAYYLYELPAGQGHRLSAGKIGNQILGGWYASGIVTAHTGSPDVVTQGTNSFGADAAGFAQSTIAIPTASVSGSSTNLYNSSCKAEGANAANKGGSGMNVFADPCAAYNSFRYVNISSDTRSGKANPFYGLPFWNFDMSFGKTTKITEKVAVRFSGDLFNVFNHHTYNDPGFSLQSPNSFGVITSTLTPANRTNSARWVQFGLRLDF